MPSPFVWGVYDGTQFQSWWEREEEFVDWLRDQDAIFYAHNGGRFDFHFLMHHFDGAARVVHGRIVAAKIGKAELRDSWALCPIPLSAYEKDAVDYTRFEALVRERHKPEILEYLYGDCRYLHELLSAFHQEHPGFPLTLPSAGLRALKRIQGLRIPEGSQAWDTKFRPFYFGGRCQAFLQGDFPQCEYQSFDLNSAYPAAMCTAHWWGPRFSVSTSLPSNPARLATTLVAFSGTSRGALPGRPNGAGPLQYFDDSSKREWHASGHEILAGLETDTLSIDRIHRVYEPEETRDFQPYVERYWTMKQAAEASGDKAQRHIAKITMNGAYGKFAQNPTHFMDWAFGREIPRAFPGRVIEVNGGARYLLGTPARVLRWYNVATAASITGAVRAQLWRAICASDGVAYCDTDSIVCRTPGFTLGSGLGEWKREGHIDHLAIAGRKLYAARLDGKWKIASKGCKISAEDVIRIARGGTVRWASEAPTFSLWTGEGFLSREIRRTQG